MNGWAQLPGGEAEEGLAEWVALAEEAKRLVAAAMSET
jgi:hypothetical protein